MNNVVGAERALLSSQEARRMYLSAPTSLRRMALSMVMGLISDDPKRKPKEGNPALGAPVPQRPLAPMERRTSNLTVAQRERLSHDEAQARLAARANGVIAVLLAIERLIPLAPWQRRQISRAVADRVSLPPSLLPNHPSNDAKSGAGQPITKESAWSVVSFLLKDCGLTHRQAADLVADHPWTLALDRPATRCAPLLECLRLLNVSPQDVGAIVAQRPWVLLTDAESEVLPLLAYISGLGLSETESTELLRRYPQLLEPGAQQRLAASVAFWVGRGMPRVSLQRLLCTLPEVAGMTQQLMQIKVDWLMEHAAFTSADFAEAIDALKQPLGMVTAPRVAFAQHRGFKVLPPSKLRDLQGSESSADPVLAASEVLAATEAQFLRLVGASDAEFRAFEAAWRSTDFRMWVHRLSPNAVLQYEGLDWLAEAELAQLRETHDRYMAAREMSWEQQDEREKEWRAAWQQWRREQTARDVLTKRLRRAVEKQETEALRLATNELALLVEKQRASSLGIDNCRRSVFCSRPFGHKGLCNREYGGAMEEGEEEEPDGGVSDVGETETTPTPSAEEIQSQPVSVVRACATGIENLLRAAPRGVLSPAMIDSWAEKEGYCRATVIAAKGVLTVTGVACVLGEPSWRYYKVLPRVWQLLEESEVEDDDPDETDVRQAQLSVAWQLRRIPRRVTKGIENVLVTSSMVLHLLRSVPEGVMLRREVDGWAQTRPMVGNLRHAIACLVEQGLVVQRRKRHVTSGPMEVAILDLSMYLEGEGSRHEDSSRHEADTN